MGSFLSTVDSSKTYDKLNATPGGENDDDGLVLSELGVSDEGNGTALQEQGSQQVVEKQTPDVPQLITDDDVGSTSVDGSWPRHGERS